MCWKLQFVLLAFVIQNVSSQNDRNTDAEMETDTDVESGQFFSHLYKRNLYQMVRIKNDSLDPCDDFYSHACGNFDQHLQEDPDEILPPYLYNKQDRMNFFSTQVHNFETIPGKLISQLYAECRNREAKKMSNQSASATHWEHLLEEIPFLAGHKEVLFSWPFLKHQWEQKHLNGQLNWIVLSAQLAAHGLPTLLHIYFALDTIYVSPIEDLPCPSIDDFHSSLSDVLQNRHRHVSHIIGYEMRVLCRRMRGELPLVRSLMRNGESTTTKPSQEQLLLDENTMDYFQHFFAALNFSTEQLEIARKFPLDVEKITQAWEVLRQTEPRIVYNYVMWQAKEQLRYPDCYKISEEFERLLHSEYWQWHILSPHLTREVALASYQLHTTRFQKLRRSSLSRRDWYGHLWPASVEKKELQVARILQVHAQSYLNITELNEVYTGLGFVNGSFHGNLLLLRRAQLRHSFVSPYIDEDDVNQPAYFLRHFIHFVLLSLHRPTYHYYATQGLELWRQSRLLLDTDGRYTAMDCLERQSLQHYDAALAPIYRPLGSDEIEDIFHFYRSFQAARRDYDFWLQGERFAFAETFVLQFFGLDIQRVLFYAVAQQLCNRHTDIFAAQLNRGYMNMPEFQEAFKCKADKAMNPSSRCMINMCE
ncbi:LOW QUALITY PROTEIN: uncharacterized protein LOC108118414 [Drosophila eugracilis]|uniref:LOW QUALITY PROTEIN: uncharacterized protein LOC108118414 n=1 Tax=Drosophila eugracilis TaxID=29029 RepID=UPI001BD9D458|nr:LOW QUALITY PROTEIN: uncharacterized protein LOC108118414 [Drosophila eugracilis]